jgi:hypothetical protein
MANDTVTKTICDAVDEFDLQHTCASSLTCIMHDLLDDYRFECDLEVNDPWHPAQRLYACINAIQHQLKTIENIVHTMPNLKQ